jgi:hypothetical protein
MALEQKIKFVWDFIENRNDVESMYRNNYVAFCLMWYIETNATLTVTIVEGVLYGTLPLLSLPRLIFTNTCEYSYSFAMMLLMQAVVMGSSIKINFVPVKRGYWSEIKFLEGWQIVEHREHWFVFLVVTLIFMYHIHQSV